MTTKEYLSQVGRLDKMIKNKISELEQCRVMFQIIPASAKDGERVMSTPDPDKLGAAYAKIDEMEREINAMINAYVDKKRLIVSQIDAIPDELNYEILFLRYINRKTFEEIATEIHNSYRNATRLHGKALKEFENMYGNTYLRDKLQNMS